MASGTRLPIATPVNTIGMPMVMLAIEMTVTVLSVELVAVAVVV